MYCFPDEILLNILSYADEKSAVILGKLSKRIMKLIDGPKF